MVARLTTVLELKGIAYGGYMFFKFVLPFVLINYAYGYQCNINTGLDLEESIESLVDDSKKLTASACEDAYIKAVAKNPSLKLCEAVEKPKFKEPTQQEIASVTETLDLIDDHYAKIESTTLSTRSGDEMRKKVFGDVDSKFLLPLSNFLRINVSDTRWKRKNYHFNELGALPGSSGDVSIKSPFHEIVKEFDLSDGEKEEFKKQVAKRFVEFSNRKKCQFGVEMGQLVKSTDLSKYELSNMGMQRAYKTEGEANKDYKANIDQIDKYMEARYPKDKRVEENTFCGPMKVAELQTYKHSEFTCNASFSKDFDSNVSSIDALSDEDKESLDRFNKCIADFEAKGFKIPDGVEVKISASASKTNNNLFESGFCPWDFEGLAKARALNTAKLIQSSKMIKQLIAIDIPNSGASGPCPYKMVNGKRVFLDKYKDKATRAELLQPYKRVTMSVVLDSYSARIPVGKAYFTTRAICKEITFQCKPNIGLRREDPRYMLHDAKVFKTDILSPYYNRRFRMDEY